MGGTNLPLFQAIQGNVLILELKFLELEFCVKLDFHMVDFRVIFATMNAADVAFPIKKARWNSIFAKSSSLKSF